MKSRGALAECILTALEAGPKTNGALYAIAKRECPTIGETQFDGAANTLIMEGSMWLQNADTYDLTREERRKRLRAKTAAMAANPSVKSEPSATGDLASLVLEALVGGASTQLEILGRVRLARKNTRSDRLSACLSELMKQGAVKRKGQRYAQAEPDGQRLARLQQERQEWLEAAWRAGDVTDEVDAELGRRNAEIKRVKARMVG